MIGRLRAVSGCVLLAYVVTHLSNHALGLWSLQAADTWLAALSSLWRWPAVTALLSAALMVHAVAALHAVWRRHTWRLGHWEWAQLLLGLSIVPLAMDHVVGTRVANEWYGVHTNHFWVLWPMAVDPWENARQCALVVVVWLHACVGVHFWWRIKPWYPRVMPWLYAVALLLPAMALAGAGVALGSVLMILEDPAKMKAAIDAVGAPSRAEVADLQRLAAGLKWLALALLVAALLGRQVREWILSRHRGVTLEYVGGPAFSLPAGGTLLEASRRLGVPHASVCGGRGRCSTCRTHLGGSDIGRLPPPDEEERRVLDRIAAGQGVRLACQLRLPPGGYRVLPLLPADAAQPSDAYRGTVAAAGDERVLVVMFVDLRDFTSLSQRRLPFDVVFLLNRYFRAAGEAVTQAGGRVDKFIGDGMMALFGLEGEPAQAARQALLAVRLLGQGLQRLNVDLAGELAHPLRIGIGLHLGPVIAGVLGHGSAMGLTAIGDTVNTASRLESLSKELGVTLVASQAVFDAAGLNGPIGLAQVVRVRGRDEALAIRTLVDLSDMP